MYDHELKLGDRVTIEISEYEDIEGTVTSLSSGPYITVTSDEGFKYAGPEYKASPVYTH